MSDDLRNHLHRTADDVHFEVPDLRPRAKAARTRRRLLATGTVAATLVLAAALILPMNLGNTQAVPAETTKPPFTPSPEPTPSPLPSRTNTIPEPPSEPGPVVAHEAIVERCSAQLTASIDAFGPIPDDLRVARNREYHEGDIVRLVSDSGWDPSTLCVIPRADDSGSSGIQATLTGPPADRALEACSELYTREDEETEQHGYDTLDIRDATILGLTASMNGDRDTAHLIVARRGEQYTCGWSFRTDGTIRSFGDDEPIDRIEKNLDYPAMGSVTAGAEWDGASATGQFVIWGEFNEHIDSIRIDDAVSATLWQSSDMGLYQAIIEVIPTGTADDWSSEPFHIVSVDEHGQDVGSQGLSLPGSSDEDES